MLGLAIQATLHTCGVSCWLISGQGTRWQLPCLPCLLVHVGHTCCGSSSRFLVCALTGAGCGVRLGGMGGPNTTAGLFPHEHREELCETQLGSEDGGPHVCPSCLQRLQGGSGVIGSQHQLRLLSTCVRAVRFSWTQEPAASPPVTQHSHRLTSNFWWSCLTCPLGPRPWAVDPATWGWSALCQPQGGI